MRVKCMQAMFKQRLRDQQLRESTSERHRRIEMDLQMNKQRNKELEQKLVAMEKKKYEAELKAKESEGVNRVRQSAQIESAKS